MNEIFNFKIYCKINNFVLYIHYFTTIKNKKTKFQLSIILKVNFSYVSEWEILTEMNNSVYGNPSSLTIQNDKKKGKPEIIFSLSLTLSKIITK